MWQDRGPVYDPGMRRRPRILPLKTRVALTGCCLVIVIFGVQAIHGYFWLLSNFGRLSVHLLQWLGVA